MTTSADLRALRPYDSHTDAASWIGAARVCLDAHRLCEADTFTRNLAADLLAAMAEQERANRERGVA